MPLAEYKGGTIFYTAKGKGPAVVFLHGFLESHEIWKDFAKSLENRHKVILIDLPGHGRSSNFGYCHTMEFMAEAVISILKNEKIRRFHVIGHSMGGYVAMALAEKVPDFIRGLCMFHSTADSDSEEKKKNRLRVIKVVQKDKKHFLNEAITNLFNIEYKPYSEEIKWITSLAKNMSTQGIIASLEGMRLRPNREIVLKFAPYPILFIIGKSDNILPWKKLVKEAHLNEMGGYILLENSGHMGFLEDPETCLKALNELLKRKF